MAPIKRSRAADEDDEEEDLLDLESASSSSRRDSRKKFRTSNGGARPGGPEIREDSDNGEDEDSRNGPASSLGNPADEAMYEERATQAIYEKYHEDVENVAQENGIIEQVDVTNFMCHERFTFDLGPLINFIVGKNGSGKSAVLTALTLCLGGKASSTNRGQSLKNFIQEGKDWASVSVKIKNQGESAYLPGDYGDSITVERHFNRNGTSWFKLRSKTGRVISSRKADLEAICDYFALQIDNPMNVLSQDLARQFLSTSSPAEKYKFFVRGVQLEQLDQDYRLLEETIDNIEHKLGGRQDDIKILEDRKEKARMRMVLSDKHDSLRDRIRNLRRQMAWAQVEEQERIRDSFDGELRMAGEKIASAEADAAAQDAAFQQAEEALEQAKRTKQEAEAERNRMQDEKKELKDNSDAAKGELQDLQTEQRTIREHLKNASGRIAKAQQDITEETQRLEDLNGGSHTRRMAEIDEKKTEAAETRNRYDLHRQDADRVHENCRAAEKDFNDTKGPIAAKKTDIEKSEERLRGLTRDRGEQRGGFHDRMPMLLRAIQQETSFGRRPVGPVGNHVRLLKPEWSSILETSFGSTLGSFMVTSKRDQSLLSNIMKRVNCVCPILIGSDDPIDTSAQEPDPKFDTWLRVLEIDHELVRRQVVIQHSVEQIILVPDSQMGLDLMTKGPRLNNVKQCFSFTARAGCGVAVGYGRGGEERSGPIRAYNGSPRMKTDIETQISLQRTAIEQHKRDLNDLEHAFRTARNTFEKCKQAINRHKKQEQELQIAVQQAEDKVEALKEALDQDRVEDGRLEALKSHLQEAEEEKRVNEGSYEDSVIAVDNAREKLKEARHAMESKATEIAEVMKSFKQTEAEFLKVEKKREAALREMNAAFEGIGDRKKDKASVERKREALAAKVADYIEKASMVSQRVNIDEGETPNSLDKKLEKLSKDLQSFNQEMGASREEIAAEAAKTKAAYVLARKQVVDLERVAQMLKSSLIERRERWKKFRSYISSRAKAQFTYLLSERSFRGRLLTNHQEKLLDLQVEPDITKDSAGRGAKTLSGGEKSFSQICLLLSLWEAMGSPIRCLDEFDVFMDSVNRRMSIEMLMMAARRSVGRQFILITPGSKGDIQTGPDVTVRELKDPERGQTTLPFGD